MHLGSSSLINPFGGSLPVSCVAWCGPRLACGQAYARLFRAPVLGQRDQELASGWASTGEGAGSGGGAVAGGVGIVGGKYAALGACTGAVASGERNTYFGKGADYQFPPRMSAPAESAVPASGTRLHHGDILPSL